ncbi:MAG: hypothetical protein KME57_18735 [Scytonema hyalinum WJT4-NPBG1]|jgi:flavodoxin|nr:hypothetical protein [Scytonema hyalinum WJT4-NPBG1]
MAKIGLFYGTQTGNTQTQAELIQKQFGGDSVVDLALDEDNQSELTQQRIKTWVAQLKQEFAF